MKYVIRTTANDFDEKLINHEFVELREQKFCEIAWTSIRCIFEIFYINIILYVWNAYNT